MPDTPTPHAPNDARDEWIIYRVRMRPEHAALLRAYAAREGSSPEELAALWLEEKIDEARKAMPLPPQ